MKTTTSTFYKNKKTHVLSLLASGASIATIAKETNAAKPYVYEAIRSN